MQVQPTKKYRTYIGIDPGTKTGMCLYEWGQIRFLETETIIWCQRYILKRLSDIEKTIELAHIQKKAHPETRIPTRDDFSMVIYLEDARMVKFATDPVKAQGAGSVKRDCSIWIEFCEEYDIDYVLLRPNNKLTKLTAPVFQQITGWKNKCSSHARDAAMLVYGK